MAKVSLVGGTTSYIADLFIQDSSQVDGRGLTGLAFGTGSLVASYLRPGAARVAITLITQTVTGAYSSGGFVEVDATNMPGVYRLDIPDAALAAGVKSVLIMLKGAANMAPCVMEIELTAVNNQDAVSYGLTALPNAAAGANGGLPTGNASGQVAVASFAANAITATAIAADAITAAKVADGTIDAATFAAGAINAAAIAADAITAAKVADGTIDAATFAAGAINAAAIATDAITAAKIAADAIGASELAADAVTEIQSGLATASALATVQADTDDIQARLPAALVGGRIDASIGAAAANTLTASALATDAVTEIQAAVAAGAVASVTGAVGSVTGNVGGNVTGSVGSVAAGGITAASFAADAITAAKIAADVGTEIATAVWASGTRTLTSFGTLVADVVAAVWDELIAGHLGAGSTGAALNAAGSAGDPWTTPLPGAYGAGTAGFIVGTDLDTTVSSRASGAALTTVQADTDDIQSRLPAALVGGKIDASVGALGTGAITAASFAAGAIDAAAIATDAIGSAELAASAVTEIQSGLATSAALGTAQADLDDIQTRLPAALVSGRIDASVGAMAAAVITATSLGADAITASKVAGDVGAEIAASVRTELTTELARIDAAITSRLSAAGYTAPDNATIAAIAGFIDTEVAAIKAKTDLIPAVPAAVGSAMTLDPAQALANGQVEGTVGYALVGSEVQSAGDWVLAGTVLTLKRKNGSTFVVFNIDDADAPTQRIAV